MAMQLWMSHCYIVIRSFHAPLSYRILLNHLASHVAKNIDLYSDFVKERARVGCYMLIQKIPPEPNVKQ